MNTGQFPFYSLNFKQDRKGNLSIKGKTLSTGIIQAEITVARLHVLLYARMDPTQPLELSPGIEGIVWAGFVTSPGKLLLSHGKQWYLQILGTRCNGCSASCPAADRTITHALNFKLRSNSVDLKFNHVFNSWVWLEPRVLRALLTGSCMLGYF